MGARGSGLGVGDRGIRNSSGWTSGSMMGLRSSTPRIFIILSKVTGLMTPFTFVPVQTVGSFMGSLTDGTFKRLTRVPDTAWITLDVTLKRNVVLQGHSNNTGASRDLFKARKMLIGDVNYFAKRGKSQTKPNVSSFHR